MGEAADEWQGRVDTTDEYIDRIIAAANSIPEGAPVGTIARRPDGGWVAHRTVGLDAPFWEYFRLDPNAHALKNQYDADSWPQIRPDQWPDQSGLDWFPPGEEPLVTRPDPTAQQEPEQGWLRQEFDKAEKRSAGIPDRARPKVDKQKGASLSRGLDDLAAGRVSRRDDYLEPQREPCCGVSEVYDCDCPPAIRITPKPRTPRVVDRLGVDERGSRWHGAEGAAAYFHDGQSWRTNQGRVFPAGYQPDWNAPYTEITDGESHE